VEADWAGSPLQAEAEVPTRPPAPNLVAQPQPLAPRPSSSLRETQLEQAILGQAIHGLSEQTLWFAARVPRVRRRDVAAHQFDEAALVWKAAALARKATALVPD
jgi:hypothetical protein